MNSLVTSTNVKLFDKKSLKILHWVLQNYIEILLQLTDTIEFSYYLNKVSIQILAVSVAGNTR